VEQARVAAELAEKIQLQRLLAELSTRFVALPSSQVSTAIAEAQRMIVQTLGLDRCTLWQRDTDGPDFVLTHCWQRPGWASLPLRYPIAEKFPRLHARLIRGEFFHFSRIEDLPPEAALDAVAFQRHNVKSNVAIPLVANGEVFGVLAFSALSEERAWCEDELLTLKLVAQIISNVVARQRAELCEEQLRGDLAHAMRVAALGELAAAFAHELNQPLAAILSNAQAARRFLDQGGIDPTELRMILDDIVRDDKRAGSVIHNLRQMASKHPVDREECCLNHLALEVIELMHGEFVAQNIEVHSTLAPHLPRVQAASVELQQVLVNLLMNAMHAMKNVLPAHRFIEIQTHAEAGSVALSIRDHGHGILAERLPRIFEAFYSTRQGGLGLGLSICRRLIENHSGRIEASNRGDGGACFTIRLPGK
jgi:signal transduction histidine kinase